MRPTQLRVLARVSDTLRPGLVLPVRAVDGDWLLLSGGAPGWVKHTEVLDLRSAEVRCSQALAERPDDAVALHVRGVVRMETGRLQAALSDFDAAAALAPEDAAVRNSRGICLIRLGKISEALADFERAIAAEPALAEAYVNRGIALAKSGKEAEALGDFERAAELRPRYAAPHGAKAVVRLLNGDWDGAIADFDRCLELDPTDPRAYAGRGVAWSAKRKYVRALADFDAAIHFGPRLAAGYAYRAELLAACDDPTVRNGRQALEDAERARRLSSAVDWRLAAALAAACAEAQDLEKARFWCAEALRLAPREARPLLERRRQAYRSGRPAYGGLVYAMLLGDRRQLAKSKDSAK